MNTILHKQLTQAKHAAPLLGQLSTAKKNAVLKTLAKVLRTNQTKILRANQLDLAALPAEYTMTDRLTLTPERIASMCTSLLAVTKLTDPLGEVLDQSTQPSGLHIERVRVPLGVIGVIYEARPNVTIEIFSLAFKTGNVTVLKGSRDAYHTNLALVKCIQASLREHTITTHCVQLIDPRERELTTELLRADGYVDVVIPRGSNKLIQFVRQVATVPVIETGAGVCHTYVEKTANIAQAVQIVVNAKTRRPTVCNTLDCLVIDQAVLAKFFPTLATELAKKQVEILADLASYRILQNYYPKNLLHKAKPEDFGTEFLSLKMSIKTVSGFDEAIKFIQAHTSKHSEAIITQNKIYAKQFTNLIDAAAVYVNTSTAFTDGFEFGLGAEVGISTQKLHARGPMGLTALTSYKWIVSSNGQIRSN